MSDGTYRSPTREELEALRSNGCVCMEPERVSVSQDFQPDWLKDVILEGEVSIGSLGARSAPALYSVTLKNVAIGNRCAIRNVGGYIANADLEDGVIVEDVGTIECSGTSCFGNGTEVSALNEAGGREMLITELTSAQEAYLAILHRSNGALCEKLHRMAEQFAENRKSDRLRISEGATVRHTAKVENVNIGAFAVVDGASRLTEGTVCSSAESPAKMGSGVIADNFIVGRGATLFDGAMVSSSFIGEGARVGKQFSCEDSLLFANSEGLHSEVCSLFAGPYSVTHHRSTLLIAVMTLFYNAGSGTNQSNHMYKLGPVHQGILERGCKTGSFSYLLWPARVGPFSAVMGKHYSNFDTSDFPFSYIDEENGKSTLIPGMNLFTVGTLRDGEKWPKRDRRKHDDKQDLIVFDVLSPYTAGKMLRGQRELERLQKETEKKQEYVKHNGILIKRLLLRTCARYYKMALEIFLGDTILGALESMSVEELKTRIEKNSPAGQTLSPWVDMCGLLCEKEKMESLADAIAEGRVQSLQELKSQLEGILQSYREDAFRWAVAAYREVYGRDLADGLESNLETLVESWKKASLKFFNMVKGDAGKEFEEVTRTGFGVDSDKERDFEAVRGSFESNDFVESLEARVKDVHRLSEKVKSRLS